MFCEKPLAISIGDCDRILGTGGDYYVKDWHADRSKSLGLLLQRAPTTST